MIHCTEIMEFYKMMIHPSHDFITTSYLLININYSRKTVGSRPLVKEYVYYSSVSTAYDTYLSCIQCNTSTVEYCE